MPAASIPGVQWASDKDLGTQVHALVEALKQNPSLQAALKRARELQLPDWYLGAGCVTQTIWNIAHGKQPDADIKDYDLVYFDPADTSHEAEDVHVQAGKRLFSDLAIEVDIKNVARIHLWYEDHFGYEIDPYVSTEDAINTWPTTATAVGIRAVDDDRHLVYAPFGLNDLFGLIVRPNKRQVTKEIYMSKVERWIRHWPRLTVIDWDSGKAAGGSALADA